jgi:hypothetical protein
MSETRSDQTGFLLMLLGGDGFVGGETSWVGPDDGYVEHSESGIQIHASTDMIRLIVPEHGATPEYRLVLGRRGLSTQNALRIMARHARTALEQRRN